MQVCASSTLVPGGLLVAIQAAAHSSAEQQAAAERLCAHRFLANVVPAAHWQRWLNCQQRQDLAQAAALGVSGWQPYGQDWCWQQKASGHYCWRGELPDNALTAAALARLAGEVSFDLLAVTLAQLEGESALHREQLLNSASAAAPTAGAACSADKHPLVESAGC